MWSGARGRGRGERGGRDNFCWWWWWRIVHGFSFSRYPSFLSTSPLSSSSGHTEAARHRCWLGPIIQNDNEDTKENESQVISEGRKRRPWKLSSITQNDTSNQSEPLGNFFLNRHSLLLLLLPHHHHHPLRRTYNSQVLSFKRTESDMANCCCQSNHLRGSITNSSPPNSEIRHHSYGRSWRRWNVHEWWRCRQPSLASAKQSRMTTYYSSFPGEN